MLKTFIFVYTKGKSIVPIVSFSIMYYQSELPKVITYIRLNKLSMDPKIKHFCICKLVFNKLYLAPSKIYPCDL